MFCKYCGKELVDDALFCSKCGNETTLEHKFNNPQNNYTEQFLLTKYCERVKTNAIIWMVLGSLQILMGIYWQWFLFIVGIVNLITAIKDFNYSKNVLQDSKGIVERVKPLTAPIIILIYNILFGGLIGVAGSIYYLVAVRGFVLENEQQFQIIDNRRTQKN